MLLSIQMVNSKRKRDMTDWKDWKGQEIVCKLAATVVRRRPELLSGSFWHISICHTWTAAANDSQLILGGGGTHQFLSFKKEHTQNPTVT